MRQNKQNDFYKGFDTLNADYGAIGSGEGNQWRRSWSAGYDEKHAEPGEVYILLGLLRRFRVRAKIGLSRRVQRRLQEIREDHGSLIFPVFVISTDNMIRLEKAAHHRFKAYNKYEERGSGRTEWFEISPLRLIKMIWFLFCKEKVFQYSDRLLRLKNRL